MGGGLCFSRGPLRRTTDTSSESSSRLTSERTAKTARRFGSAAAPPRVSLRMLFESSTTKTNWAAPVSAACAESPLPTMHAVASAASLCGEATPTRAPP